MARPSERTEPVLHNRLAVLRAERGLSRQDLAQALGVNYQTVGYLERGEYNPSLELALRAAEHFGLPVEAIFSRRPFAPMSSQLYGTPSTGQRMNPTEGERDA
jgi:putative transcriptional regulator